MKSTIILCLTTVVLPTVFGIGMIPLPNYQPTACNFYAPTDAPTLRGQNFIQNVAGDKCLVMKGGNFGPYNAGTTNKQIQLAPCTWRSLPQSDQLFLFQNSNGALTLKPSVRSFGVDYCLAPLNGQLAAVPCKPRSSEQAYRFTRVRNGPLGAALYQIQQSSSGQCLKANTRAEGATVGRARCSATDNLQLWTICTSK